MNEFIKKQEGEFKNVIEHFRKELAMVRAGRAQPTMIENILVDAYGVKTPLKQLATVLVPEARMMMVQPWDKNLLKEIEKAIIAANLGLAVSGESAAVRVSVPQLTEENRRDLVKRLNDKLEAAKVALRLVREKVKEAIMTAFKNSEITEDDKYQFVEELDKNVSGWTKELQGLASEKEKEVMTV